MENWNPSKNAENAVFECKFCNFKCSKQSNYIKHVQTKKHVYRVSGNKMEQIHKSKNANFICECGKKYLTKSGLWKHNQKCEQFNEHIDIVDSNDIIDNSNVKILTNMVLEIVKQNKELVEQNNEAQKQNQDLINKLYEICKNGTHNTTNNNNSHNKSFNLQFFLNETCKNAMNINEFVDSLQLQISDLENVGEVGYIEGISSIIIKKLNTLDVTERPIHCTDKKRETMYIKDEDKWEKEDEKKTKMHKMVKKVVNKNINMISEFQKLHPEWKQYSSKYSDQHNKIVIESMGGKGDNEYEKQEKIIKKIAKEVFVEKSP
jgi:hypothetical protein